jgi:predicted AlkP superfamily pyrophosphatase or phosphodiesterase
MYWSEPDTCMHINGAYSVEAKEILSNMDNVLKKMSEKISDDTLVIITADHGHIDVKPIYLANFTDILSMLERMPSNEGRCAFFKVKERKKKSFEKLFISYFGDYFSLLTKEEFIEEGYLGEDINNKNYKLDSFIGDYVAIAKKNYYFNFDPLISNELQDEMIFKSHHAGITENEMIIPLIVMKK